MKLSPFVKQMETRAAAAVPDRPAAPAHAPAPLAVVASAAAAPVADGVTPPPSPAAPAPGGAAPAPFAHGGGRRYESWPAGIYEAARQMGIAVPENPTALIERAKTCLAMMFVKVLYEQSEEDVIWPMAKSIAGEIEGHMAEEMSVVTQLCRTTTNKERLLWHSLHTAILAMDLAQHVPERGCSVQDIGAAALLHDIGMLLRPDGMNTLDGETGSDFREHVAHGVELAQKLKLSAPVVAMIALHHHRLDGRPESDAIAPEAFPPYCQIVAIANVFEAAVIDVTAGLAPGVAAAPPRDIPQIFRDYRQAFDNALLKKMIDLIGFYPIGSLVELSNRAVGRVIKLNKGWPLRPVVEVLVDGDGSHPETPRVADLKHMPLMAIIRSVAPPAKPTGPSPQGGHPPQGTGGS